MISSNSLLILDNYRNHLYEKYKDVNDIDLYSFCLSMLLATFYPSSYIIDNMYKLCRQLRRFIPIREIY